MSCCTDCISFNGDLPERAIIGELNCFAFDPYETDRYHGKLTFHKDIVCKTEEEAIEILEKMHSNYDDHAVMYMENGKKMWCVLFSYHC